MVCSSFSAEIVPVLSISCPRPSTVRSLRNATTAAELPLRATSSRPVFEPMSITATVIRGV